jgi:hypothetical protein
VYLNKFFIGLIEKIILEVDLLQSNPSKSEYSSQITTFIFFNQTTQQPSSNPKSFFNKITQKPSNPKTPHPSVLNNNNNNNPVLKNNYPSSFTKTTIL